MGAKASKAKNGLPHTKQKITINGKKFRLMEKLGESGCGELYKAAERSTGKEYACKIIHKSKLKNPQDASDEIKKLKSLNHQNLIKLFDATVIRDKEFGDFIYLIMEYASKGDLYDYIKTYRIDEKDAQNLFREIVTAIEYLHSKKIAHRNLKLQNCLFDEDGHFDGYIKITDYGNFDKFEHDGETRKYLAPEVLNGDEYNAFQADMFSLGIILYDLATSYGKNKMPADECKSLYEKLTSKDPYLRPSAAEVLNDPWFTMI